MTPAEEITTAAHTLRQDATAAGGGEWAVDHYPEGSIVRPADSAHSLFQIHADGLRAAGTPCVTPAVGRWMARMHPGVGQPLAELLEDAAGGDDHGEINPYALALARLINQQQAQPRA